MEQAFVVGMFQKIYYRMLCIRRSENKSEKAIDLFQNVCYNTENEHGAIGNPISKCTVFNRCVDIGTNVC